MRASASLLSVLVLAGCAATRPQGRTPYVPSAGMRAVLDERQAMHAQDPAGLSVERVREVPSLSDAAKAMENVKGLPAGEIEVPQVTPLTASGAEGALQARLYRPALAKNTPVILYYPGGTWATGSLDQYDDSARALAMRTGYVVVAMRTRLAPEARFPAEHDDAYALYRWARAHMRGWGADPTRVTLAGEGPGANLALSTALRARDEERDGARTGARTAVPDQLLLITPWAGTSLSGPSMSDSGRSRPLTRATVDWAQDLYASRYLRDPRIDLVDRPDLAGLPPTTIVLAEIDPLRSGGEALGAKLAAAGVPVETRVFGGATYDFFGLGRRVPEASMAEDYAAGRLKAAFYRPEAPVIAGAVHRGPGRWRGR